MRKVLLKFKDYNNKKIRVDSYTVIKLIKTNYLI